MKTPRQHLVRKSPRRYSIGAAASLFMLNIFAGCQKVSMTGQDCPEPNHLAAGTQVECGGRLVRGTYLRAGIAACGSAGVSGCLTNNDFPAVDTSKLVPENIKIGGTVAGIAGTLANTISAGSFSICEQEGSTDCVVANGLVAVDVTDLAPKLVIGTSAAGISGTGVPSSPQDCTGNAETGCVTTSAYPASDQGTLARCLPTGG